METLRALHRLGQLESPVHDSNIQPDYTNAYMMSVHSPSEVPSPQTDMISLAPSDVSRCKRRIDFEDQLIVPSYALRVMDHQQQQQPRKRGRSKYQTPAVLRRNERERNRVKMVNSGFTILRQHVPHVADNKKISKVDTLRAAVDYIKQLQRLLGNDVPSPVKPLSECSTSPSGRTPSPCGYSSDSAASILDEDAATYDTNLPWLTSQHHLQGNCYLLQMFTYSLFWFCEEIIYVLLCINVLYLVLNYASDFALTFTEFRFFF